MWGFFVYFAAALSFAGDFSDETSLRDALEINTDASAEAVSRRSSPVRLEIDAWDSIGQVDGGNRLYAVFNSVETNSVCAINSRDPIDRTLRSYVLDVEIFDWPQYEIPERSLASLADFRSSPAASGLPALFPETSESSSGKQFRCGSFETRDATGKYELTCTFGDCNINVRGFKNIFGGRLTISERTRPERPAPAEIGLAQALPPQVFEFEAPAKKDVSTATAGVKAP
jgi:hypothetical protein